MEYVLIVVSFLIGWRLAMSQLARVEKTMSERHEWEMKKAFGEGRKAAIEEIRKLPSPTKDKLTPQRRKMSEADMLNSEWPPVHRVRSAGD